MLSDCAEGSATQRAIQQELRSREDEIKDKGTLWLFRKEDDPASHKASQGSVV